MSMRKAFLLRVEIGIHSVDCPDIRLCQSGNVAVRVHTLSSNAVTTPGYPPFPIHFHETLLFEKVLPFVSNLSEIQNYLNAESIKVELVYWPPRSGGERIVADFRTKLSNLLFPTLLNADFIDGGRLDLIMESPRKFGGGSHPRVEVSTKIALDEKSTEIQTSFCPVSYHRGRTREKYKGTDVVRWPREGTACSDCCICNRYTGYFGSKPGSCPFLRHWYTSEEMKKPFPYRQLFYENLDFFYRQMQKKKALNHC